MLLPIPSEPPMPPLIQIVIEEKEEKKEPAEPELTIEEKIEQNYYECDESIEYIRADDATCIPRPTYRSSESRSNTESSPTPGPTQKAVKTAVRGSNTYSYGYCTHWVASNRYVPNGWGNAISWKYNAQASGWTVSSKPIVGAIAWEPIGGYGHVALVTKVDGDMVTISEKNYRGWNVVSYRTVPISTFTYLY